MPTALIALATLALLVLAKRIPEPIVILGAAIVGLLLKRWSEPVL